MKKSSPENNPRKCARIGINELNVSCSEWEILEVLWNRESITASQIHRDLDKNRKDKKQEQRKSGAVQACLLRMARKGLVRRIKRPGSATEYSTAYDRETLIRKEIHDLSNKCFEGDLHAMIITALQTKRLSIESIKQIKKALNDLEKR